MYTRYLEYDVARYLVWYNGRFVLDAVYHGIVRRGLYGGLLVTYVRRMVLYW